MKISSIPAQLPEHSPMGASGAYRWLKKCQRSVSLAQGVENEESEYAAEGTAAHTVGEACLNHGYDAWECMDHFVCGDELLDAKDAKGKEDAVEITKDMADAVQVYLDGVRTMHPDRNQGNFWIEREFYCPDIHPYFYGKSDCIYVDFPNRILHVWDYKHGAGIGVEVKENPQNMYYGVGALEDLDLWDKVDTVEMHIAQPRYKHFDGPIRSWSISVEELEDWLEDELIPAMNAAPTSKQMSSGEHCRFCNVRFHACPQLLKDADEMEELLKEMDKKGVKVLTSVQLGRMLDLNDVLKIAIKAAQTTVFSRLSAGQKIPGRKLVHTTKNREWKDEAEEALKKKFGKKAFNEPKLKSPAEIEKMAEGKTEAERWAFKPKGPLSVALADDNRREVSRDTKSMFKDQTKKRK